MPEWAWYLLLAVLLVGVLGRIVVGVLEAFAAADGTVHRLTAPRDSSLWVACDTVQCAHLQTPHDVIASGCLRCRECGHVTVT